MTSNVFAQGWSGARRAGRYRHRHGPHKWFFEGHGGGRPRWFFEGEGGRGRPRFDDLDDLITRRRDPHFLLAHPRAIAAFGRECNRLGLYPQYINLGGQQVPAWRNVAPPGQVEHFVACHFAPFTKMPMPGESGDILGKDETTVVHG